MILITTQCGSVAFLDLTLPSCGCRCSALWRLPGSLGASLGSHCQVLASTAPICVLQRPKGWFDLLWRKVGVQRNNSMNSA